MYVYLRKWCYAILCLLSPVLLSAQNGQKYLERALPQTWQENSDDFQQTLPVDDHWWSNFNDPLLDSLIAVAIKQNYSVQMAADRIAMAKANLRIQQGSYSPTLGLNAGWTRQQSSGNTTQLPQSVTQYTDASLNMNWEIDVFGSIRNRVKAQKENFAASKEEYNAVMVSLCAQVASAYINLRELQQELEVVNKNCESQLAVVKITEKRFETGLVSKLDVAQALSVYYDTKSSVPMLEAGIIQYTNSLGVLMGLYPWDVRKIIETQQPLPEYIEPVGVGIPANLLLRRPDIRSAERQVNAYAASLGASKSDWWPQIFVKGSVGFASHDIDKIANHNSLTYEIAPTLTWNFFQGTKLMQATRLAKAQLDESVRQFNETVLTSVQEVDNAMSAYKNSIKQIVALREVVNQGKETLTLSLDLYKQGLSPFQNVLDAQRSLLSYENALTQAKGNSLLSLIQLYQALGGGWSESNN
ncbi:efflux transporter outer membrane subunit [Parabacteroides chinchillae]|uniref:Efflux transporter, outer membrane factor (OMF) lipoprotein, NodT family n=1 Tax=Parabacteroides chinchillae TaxID=871327 RepID=A0A8G2BTL2_9BACT|nr:TolC family protein [Parabacteroides chinchillae]SEF41854.1 efflux transporter, outer membrane factor (OMF) lipoprotein, NodT family [Parabacteroides chinchillae]